jgi:hypothetical protein
MAADDFSHSPNYLDSGQAIAVLPSTMVASVGSFNDI